MNRNWLFSSDRNIRTKAIGLYQEIETNPFVCPHGHVDPYLFVDPNYQFNSPAEFFIIPDHYILRMLYSQGIPLSFLNPNDEMENNVEENHRKIWQLFADNFHLFNATPSGLWLQHEMETIFNINQKLNNLNAQEIYDQINEKLALPEFRPRALFNRFNLEVLATTDSATDTLDAHKKISLSGWNGKIIPTFRPDAVVDITASNWVDEIRKLSVVSNINIVDYSSFIQALEQRRAFFKANGATATDHACLTPFTENLSPNEVEAIFQKGLAHTVNKKEAVRFGGHMLIEMARMSAEDGLVMQLHTGSYRNHNPYIYTQFGPDMGADIPTRTEFTINLKPLLDRFGNHPNLRLVLFTLDESTYSRELAPLAGHYPALRLGPPWWFLDSINGIERFLNSVVETAGIYNLAGFNDDTRAFPSIPTRHEVWRRVTCNWIAGLWARKIITEEDAHQMAQALAYDLVKQTYNL